MFESCVCGAAVKTFSRRHVRDWRSNHIHELVVEPDAPEPDRQGAIATVERAAQFDYDTQPPVTARIGFQLQCTDEAAYAAQFDDEHMVEGCP